MAVEQGINKQIAFAKQTVLGTTIAGAGGFVRRRVTGGFNLETDSYDNNEIVAHQQSTGATYGLKKGSGKISGLLSPATYKYEFQSVLRKDFVAGATTGAIITVTAASTSGVQGTFTRSSGSYLTDGFKIGDIVRWTGWAGGSATNNNSVNMMIIALTATVMTVTRFDTVAIVSDAAGDSVTCTVVGKKTLAPLTAHTNDYYTVEEWYPGNTKSELFGDVQPAKIDLGLPATGNATIAIDYVALSRVLGTSRVLTSPTAETTTPVLGAVNGVIWINGAAYPITGAQLTIDGSTALGEAEDRKSAIADTQRGRIKVSGSFTALFKDSVIQTLYQNQTVTSIVLVVFDSKTLATSQFIAFSLGRVKVFGDAADDGEKQIVRTYPFTAELNSAGGAALANDQTIMSVQDSDA